jgi:hypothetical protein
MGWIDLALDRDKYQTFLKKERRNFLFHKMGNS